jgi:uncharacterized protein (TIGR01777 family)
MRADIIKQMEVLVTGSSGFIGSALLTELKTRGHGVRRLVRSGPGAGRVLWDPGAGTIDRDGLVGIEGVIHLAGVGIGSRRWNAAHKARVLDSRVRGTHLLSETVASLSPVPQVMVSASASGYYGDRGDEQLTESSEPGTDFLAEVCKQWEAATESAANAGVRVARTRSGIVLSKRGGAFARLLFPFRMGVGGPLGSGRQYWPWITLRDEVRAMAHLLETDGLSGPFNLCASDAVTQAEFARTLARLLRRPSIVPAPAFALKAVLGELADALVLASQRMVPARLLETGFEFEHPQLEAGLRWAIAN